MADEKWIEFAKLFIGQLPHCTVESCDGDLLGEEHEKDCALSGTSGPPERDWEELLAEAMAMVAGTMGDLTPPAKRCFLPSDRELLSALRERMGRK